jgi:hypothetical protein
MDGRIACGASHRSMKFVASRRSGWHDPRPMNDFHANAVVLTSARMAAGMTSRARRPELFDPAG